MWRQVEEKRGPFVSITEEETQWKMPSCAVHGSYQPIPSVHLSPGQVGSYSLSGVEMAAL